MLLDQVNNVVDRFLITDKFRCYQRPGNFIIIINLINSYLLLNLDKISNFTKLMYIINSFLFFFESQLIGSNTGSAVVMVNSILVISCLNINYKNIEKIAKFWSVTLKKI